MPNAHGEVLPEPQKPIPLAKRFLYINRVDWYLREYGRFPTYDELIALREIRKFK